MTMIVVPKKLMASLITVGVLPALLMVLLLRLKDGQLEVLGQAVAEYDLARLFAALVSIMLPLYLVMPLALGADAKYSPSYWLLVAACPLFLFGPGLLAGLAVGGNQPGAPLLALLLLSVLLLNLTLWVTALSRLFGYRGAALVYGSIWVVSKYVTHLRAYVLPYLEVPILQHVHHLNWLLPQVESAPSLIDDYLQVGQLEGAALAPTFLQTPLLAMLLFLHLNKCRG